MFRSLVPLVLFTLIASACLAVGDGKLHVYFIDVGQGDSTLIIGPQGTSVLLDGGASNSSRANIEAAMDAAIAAGLTDNKLDYTVVSHFHTDHLGAIELVAQTYAGGLIAAYDRGGSYSSTAFNEYNNYFGSSRKNAQSFSIGTGCTMTYCGKATAGTSDENNNGVLYRLDFGNFKCSLTGDLGGSYEISLADNIGRVDHYKVNHHGSATSSQTGWLNVILPSTHTFSYGQGNSYGHPTADAINRCEAVGSVRYDTLNHESGGTVWVHLVTDGNISYTVNGDEFALGGVPIPQPPAAPSNLAASALSSSEIYLTWSDNSSDETGFIVARATVNGGPYTDIATLGAGVTSYSNTGLAAGTTYYYVVRATNDAGDSANSNQASATTDAGATAPAAPSNLRRVSSTASSVLLAWNDNSSNETSFEIWYTSVKNGTFTLVGTVGANVTQFNHTGLTAGTKYWKVRAVNASGASAFSNTVTYRLR